MEEFKEVPLAPGPKHKRNEDLLQFNVSEVGKT